jgi:hypothetical protein
VFCALPQYKDYTDAVYVDGKLTYASTMCTDCPSIGFDCAEPGNALETLRIKSGFWRSHALSSRVRECLTPEYCVDCTRHPDAALCTAAPATADRRLAAQQSISSSNLTNPGCIPLHRGPFCALCVDGSIVGVDSNGQRHCVECQGSIAATFALPLGILAVMLILAFICVRAIPGRLGTLADELNDAVFDVGKTGDLDDVASAVKESAVVVAEAETGEQLSNVSTRLQAAAEKRGCTRERFLSVQVKLRILVSLIQVISQLGVVFQIPYPPFYSDMVDWLGVFSVLDSWSPNPRHCALRAASSGWWWPLTVLSWARMAAQLCRDDAFVVLLRTRPRPQARIARRPHPRTPNRGAAFRRRLLLIVVCSCTRTACSSTRAFLSSSVHSPPLRGARS